MNISVFFIFKVLISGLIIAVVSEVSKSSTRWGAILTALPMVTLLSILWMYFEQRDLIKLSSYCKDVILWTLPSFFFFIAAIYLFKTKLSFPISFGLSLIAMAAGVVVFQRLGIIK